MADLKSLPLGDRQELINVVYAKLFNQSAGTVFISVNDGVQLELEPDAQPLVLYNNPVPVDIFIRVKYKSTDPNVILLVHELKC